MPRIHTLFPISRLHSINRPHIRFLHSHHALFQRFSPTAVAAGSPTQEVPAASSTLPHPLSILPFGMLLRSYLITTLSTSPLLLNTSLRLLSVLARSKSAFLSPDRNPLLHFILKKTFYAQFCAGETANEVLKVSKSIKAIGFGGIILGHAREVVLCDGESVGEDNAGLEAAKADVDSWMQGTLETLNMTDEGDQVALK
jgi:proline dehydrogenase